MGDGILIVARRYSKRIDIFSGSLPKLIANKDRLSRQKREGGDYQFTFKSHDKYLLVEEADGLILTKLGETPYAADDKIADKDVERREAYLKDKSPEERKKFIEDILDKKELEQ